MVVGGILYVITAFLLELRDPSFKNSKDLRASLDYKLLTMVPNLEEKSFLGWTISSAILPEHQTTEAPNSIASEAYKMLYTNLQFLTSDRDINVIAVTSSIPQEGKSTVSANLASAIAQLGQKVLLIDGDLHKPRQHSVWDLNNQIGLIEVLQGKVLPSEAIQSLQVNPNLDVLTAGWNPGEYLSLLQSERMSQLIALFRQNYDLVVIDTPPVLLFADTLTISKNTDGIILVGRLGVTNPTTTQNVKELLQQSGQKILGVVVNAVNRETESYYQYAKNYDRNLQQKPKSLSPSSNQ
jgi:capsular exopolysaccharide synthesis family protein